jgi:Histidine kinase-, DNA gyrase B-, and HSP90-like ATPase
MPPFAIKRLFQPFARGGGNGNPQGSGPGLYIASEIARAHGGMLTAGSSAEETRFTFRMPLHLQHEGSEPPLEYRPDRLERNLPGRSPEKCRPGRSSLRPIGTPASPNSW